MRCVFIEDVFMFDISRVEDTFGVTVRSPDLQYTATNNKISLPYRTILVLFVFSDNHSVDELR